MRYFRISTLSFLAILLLFSCKKDENIVQPFVSVTPGPIVGSLDAVQSKGYFYGSNVPLPLITNYASASFVDTTIQDSCLEAGIVTCEGVFLSRNNPITNFYYFTTSKSMTYDAIVDWSVSGGAHVPTFNVSIGLGFPYISEPLTDTVDISKPFRFTSDTITNSDFIYFSTIWDYWGLAYPDSLKSVTYSPADMASLVTSSAIPGYLPVEIVAYRETLIVSSGQTYRYRNYYRVTKEIWFE